MRGGSIFILFLLILIAVGGGFYYYAHYMMPAPATAEMPAVGTPVSFREVVHGVQSSVLTRTNYRITSSSELTRLWKMIDATDAPPAIDFDRQEVIAVFAGSEPTAGYDISVTSVRDANTRIVHVTLTKPGGSCLLAQMTTAPYQIIVFDKTALSLSHEDEVKTTSCLE